MLLVGRSLRACLYVCHSALLESLKGESETILQSLFSSNPDLMSLIISSLVLADMISYTGLLFARRDFTINAIYSDIEGNLFDPFNGKEDLEKGLVKFIGDPEQRIKEDFLRILRYLRFHLSYSNHNHEPETTKIIKKNIVGISNLSKERLLNELKKFFKSNSIINPARVPCRRTSRRVTRISC